MSATILPFVDPFAASADKDHLRQLADRMCRSHSWIKTANGPKHYRNVQLNAAQIDAHVAGDSAYGLCPIAPGASTTRAACLDFDSHKGETPWPDMLATAGRVASALKLKGLAPHLFRSNGGSGVHIILTWDKPQDAYSVREVLRTALDECGLKEGSKGGVAAGVVEVFPKQDSVRADGWGSMFVLPFNGDRGQPLGEFRGFRASCDVPAIERAANEPSKPVTTDASAINADYARDRAIDYMDALETATEGDRNGTLFDVSCYLKDIGVPCHDSIGLIRERWKCEPALDDDEIEKTVRSAYAKNRLTAQGSKAPENVFNLVPEAETKPAAKSRLHFEMFADINPELARPELVEGVLEHGAMSVLYGESNTGKTFVAMDLAFHVATGRPWMGRHTERGLCVYIAAEGGSGARKRVKALRTHYDVTTGIPFALVPCSVDLSGKGADVQPILNLIMDAQKACGQSPALVVVDTLSRAMAGGNENASEDMTAFVANVDRLRTKTKAHLLVIHHSGKDKARGARGHSSLRAATDTELEVADRTVTAAKQRDMDPAAPIGFDLLPVTIGANARGKPVTSCVLVERNLSAQQAFQRAHIKAGSVAGKALETLENLTMGGSSVPVAKWRDEFQRIHGGTRKVARKAFDRATETLRKAQGVTIENGHAVLAQ